jgi:hypothetical protein
MKKTLLICLLAAPIVFFFQNCQKATYHASDSSSAPGVLTAVSDGESSQELSQGDNSSLDQQDPTPASDASGEYICILAGPGNSAKLGLTQEQMAAQHRTPDLICMTQDACLNIVSAAFDVKGPKHAGFCKVHGNPHVKHLTDADLQQKVTEYLSQHP